jgi:uncharacterized protein (TIGR03083 family)
MLSRMALSREWAGFYLAQLRAESARIREIGLMGLDAAVPSCPGWTVESVLRHVATVYLHKVEVLRLGARPDPWPPDVSERDTFELYDEARTAIVDALEEAGTERATWTFNPDDKTSGFWYRRMAHESVVHRIDVEQAHDVVTPIDPELALDGIDEVLFPTLAGPWWDEGDTEHPVDAAVRITAGKRSWTVRADATGVVVSPEAEGEVAAEIFGAADAVFLWLWGRVDASAIQSAGDEDVVREFRARLAECTT